MSAADYARVNNTQITIANFYALAAWDTAGKQLNLSQRAFYSIGTLLYTATSDDDLYFEGLSLAVQLAYVNRTTFDEIYNGDFQPAGISKDKASLIYNDPNYGWRTNSTV